MSETTLKEILIKMRDNESLKYVAHMTGYSMGHISPYLNGLRSIPTRTLTIMARNAGLITKDQIITKP